MHSAFFLIFERMNVRLSYPRISSFTVASSSAVGLVCFQLIVCPSFSYLGNQVDMEMRNSLSCCRTIILNEVKAIAMQLLRHLTCHLFRQGKCFLTPVIRQLIKISKMLLRHHEGMSLCRRSKIQDHAEAVVFIQRIGRNLSVCNFTKNTIIFFM